jgi:hypothetical protein
MKSNSEKLREEKLEAGTDIASINKCGIQSTENSSVYSLIILFRAQI